MSNQYEHDNPDGRPCDACGDDAVVELSMQGCLQPVALCGGCADAVTQCPGCDENIWGKDGTRVYQSSTLYCASCCAQHPVIAELLDRALRLDEARDVTQQVRR